MLQAPRQCQSIWAHDLMQVQPRNGRSRPCFNGTTHSSSRASKAKSMMSHEYFCKNSRYCNSKTRKSLGSRTVLNTNSFLLKLKSTSKSTVGKVGNGRGSRSLLTWLQLKIVQTFGRLSLPFTFISYARSFISTASLKHHHRSSSSGVDRRIYHQYGAILVPIAPLLD